MASLVFRHFWINGRLRTIAVLGDISVDAEFRGMGIAKKILELVNLYIKNNTHGGAFVIPTSSIKRILSGMGWSIEEPQIGLVFMIDPKKTIIQAIGTGFIAGLCGLLFQPLVSFWIALSNTKGYVMKNNEEFNESFDSLWDKVAKDKLILTERNASFLKWRFYDHPDMKFTVASFQEDGEMVGYVIYNMQQETCVVYDMIVLKNKDIKPIIMLLIKSLAMSKNAYSVKIMMNQKHPYAAFLKRAGFINRKSGAVFQAYNPFNRLILDDCTWFVTACDKDI
jgi:hypothetical protein